MDNLKVSDKIVNRMLSDKMHRGFKTMIRIYCSDMSQVERNKFADLLVKQMNVAYRVAIHERKLKTRFKSFIKSIKGNVGSQREL